MESCVDVRGLKDSGKAELLEGSKRAYDELFVDVEIMLESAMERQCSQAFLQHMPMNGG